jgi:hypothetical protein
MEHSMEHKFAGRFKKVRRSPDHLEMLRLHMAHKVFLGIPFLKKQEIIFIRKILAKVAPLAALIHSYGTDKVRHCLRQLLVLLRKYFHSDDEQDHERGIARGLPTNRETTL